MPTYIGKKLEFTDQNGNIFRMIPVDSTEKGAAEGVATLDASGKVPVEQLPDTAHVHLYSARSAFPSSGIDGDLYIAKATNIIYRWDSTESDYISISSAGGSGVITVTGTITNTSGAYSGTFNDARIVSTMKCILLELGTPSIFGGYVSVSCNNGSITITCDEVAGSSTFILSFIASMASSTEYDALNNAKVDKATTAVSGNVVIFGPDGTIVDSEKTLGKSVPADAVFTDTTYSDATQSASGLMSSSDKTKLDGIASGAQVNPGNATQSAAGLMSSTDKTKLDGIAEGAQVNPSNQTICNLIYPVGSIYMSVNNTSPATLFGGTWSQLKDRFLLGAGDTYTAGNTGGAASQSYTPAGSVGNHTLTSTEIPSHSHSLNSHTHSVGAHSHGLNSHTHKGPNHKHSVGAHSHGLNSHTHSYTDYYANTTSGSTTLTTDQIPSHNHHAYGSASDDKFIKHGPSGNSGAADFVYQAGIGTGTCATVTASTGGGGGHTHSVSNTSTSRTSGQASGSTANSAAFDSGEAGTGNTGAASGSTANSTAFDTGAASGNTASTGGGGAHNHSFTGTAATINTMPPYLVVYMWKRTA